MGFRRIMCVDLEPRAVPQIYLCPKMDQHTLMTAAVRYTKDGETVPEGQIADGAQLIVAPEQCVLLLRGGQIFDLCAAPGVYIYEQNSPASFLMGKLTCTGGAQVAGGEGEERVLYLNAGEFGGNAFSCPQKLTFQSDDGAPISLMCRGRYCYRIANPLLFYRYAREMTDRGTLDAFLLEQFLTVLQPTYDRLASMGVKDSTLSDHTPELIATLRALLYDKWYTNCGIELQRVSITSVCMAGGFGGTTLQADRDELSTDDQLEKAAKEFFGSMLSAFGSAFQLAEQKETPKGQSDNQVTKEK